MAYQLGHIPAHTGKQVAEEPIREVEHIKAIKDNLSSIRDRALFTLGINTAFRCGDLINIKVGQVRNRKAGDDVVIKEEKTGKVRRITLNDQSSSAVATALQIRPNASDDDYLFIGQRGKLTVSYVNRLVKTWVKFAGLNGQYGSHTLRKTWAFHQYKSFGVDIATLMEALNHSSPRQTLTYICVQSDDLKKVYSNSL